MSSQVDQARNCKTKKNNSYKIYIIVSPAFSYVACYGHFITRADHLISFLSYVPLR